MFKFKNKKILQAKNLYISVSLIRTLLRVHLTEQARIWPYKINSPRYSSNLQLYQFST